MCQALISGRMQEPDASALERGSELDEQIVRLQCLVCHLLEKNEELRRRLATSLREGRAEVHRAEVVGAMGVSDSPSLRCDQEI